MIGDGGSIDVDDLQIKRAVVGLPSQAGNVERHARLGLNIADQLGVARSTLPLRVHFIDRSDQSRGDTIELINKVTKDSFPCFQSCTQSSAFGLQGRIRFDDPDFRRTRVLAVGGVDFSEDTVGDQIITANEDVHVAAGLFLDVDIDVGRQFFQILIPLIAKPRGIASDQTAAFDGRDFNIQLGDSLNQPIDLHTDVFQVCIGRFL